jgi:SAM-dependent methyltransferase
LSPDGQARCIPVVEYLEARARGDTSLEHAFLSCLFMRNRVTKMTSTGRLDDTLPLLVDSVRRVDGRPVRVLDVGCSAGVATLEMHQAFQAAGFNLQTFGTDLVLAARFVQRHDGWGVLFDRDDQVLQVERRRWATPWIWRRRDWVFRPIASVLARRLVAHDLGPYRAALRGPVPGFECRSVSLLSSLTERSKNVTFSEEDLLSPGISGSFDLIRVANLLNVNYFSPDRIRQMAQALTHRLSDGGLLFVVRTHSDEPRNRGTLFRWSGGQLQRLVRINGGSEVQELLTS